MKAFRSIFLFIVIALILSCFQATGQVTVGSDLAPLSGVLLDIKSQDTPNAANATTSVGGLGLPRVALTDKASLSPLPGGSTANEKLQRTGLMVYNVGTAFSHGVYVWDGTKWDSAGGGVKWFYMPSITVGAVPGSSYTIQLYDEYEKQFKRTTNMGGTGPQTWVSSNGSLGSIPSPEDGTLYARNKLDYVITYYDKSVFSPTSVTIDAAGELRYTVLPGATITSKTYFNIILVVKP